MMKLEMKFRSDYLQKAAEFFYKELLPRSNLSVKIYRDSREPISDTFMYAWGVYDVCLATGLDRKNALLTLAHEFIHIKQFHKKELIPIHKAMKWRGQIYSGAHLNAPWEIEADILEKTLVEKFLALK